MHSCLGILGTSLFGHRSLSAYLWMIVGHSERWWMSGVHRLGFLLEVHTWGCSSSWDKSTNIPPKIYHFCFLYARREDRINNFQRFQLAIMLLTDYNLPWTQEIPSSEAISFHQKRMQYFTSLNEAQSSFHFFCITFLPKQCRHTEGFWR